MAGGAASDEALLERALALIPTLEARAAETEGLRRLPDATVADLHAAGLFRLFRPERYGGIEAPFGAFIAVGAALGRGCGSTSWVLNNLVSHNWMLGYWPREAQDAVWGGEPEALVGSGLIFPAGKARRVPGGHRLTGRWPFSSGIDQSAWCMLAGMAEAEGGGPPEHRLFVLPAADYAVLDTWDAMGLAGTGSKDVVADAAFVPEHLSVPATVGKGGPHPGSAANPGPLYRLTWYAMFSFVNAATVLGIAQGAIERFTQATRGRLATYTGKGLAELATMQMRIAEAATLADAAETIMLRDCAEAMRMAEAGDPPSILDRTRWRRDGAFAAQMAVKAVDLICAGAGGSAIHEQHPLQRALRDIHAASGHIGVSWDLNGTMYGRVALGLPADFPLL